MQRQSIHHRSFEKLESRQMMAGNITAVFNNNRLEIEGDTANNSFSVSVGNTPSELVITGLASSDAQNPNTTINNQAQVTITGVDPALLDIVVQLFEGDDSMHVGKISCSTFDFTGDQGNDLFQFGTYVALGDPNPADNVHTITNFLRLQSGAGDAGDDTYNINRLYGDSDFSIIDANGTTNCKIYVAFVSGLGISTAEGDDSVDIGYLTATNISVGTNEGNDTIQLYASRIINGASFVAESGNDTIAIDVNKFDDGRIDVKAADIASSFSDPGQDTVLFSRSVLDDNSPIVDQVTFVMGGGNDTLIVGKYYDLDNGNVVLRNAGSSFTYLRIDMGPGSDNVFVAANVFQRAFVFLGPGNDTQEWESNLVSQEVNVNADYSYLPDGGDTSFDVFRRKNNSFDVAGNSVTLTLFGVEQNVFY